MFLIVGLGNPGRKYDGTKHNAGFEALDKIAQEYGISCSGKEHKAICGKGIIEGHKVILAKPQTFMNNSGESIRELVDYYKINPEEELVILYDDITLEPGKLRIRKKGSAGGHNGIKSIIAHLGTQNFQRVRIGVGEKPANWDLADFVLSPFAKEVRPLVEEAMDHSVKAVSLIVQGRIDEAMNSYN